MSKFIVSDKVRTTDAWPWQNIRKGDTGVVTERVTEHSWPVVTVKFDRTGDSTDVSEEYLELVEEEKMKVVYRVEGPKGFTETLTEAQVKGLKAAGILFHNETVLYDDQIVKIYQHENDVYDVTDRRSTSIPLEKQFPRDN